MVLSFISERLSVSWVRVHLCSLAVAMSLNAWWRVPRDAFRYGGLSYALALTAAALLVAAPAALLQLAVGQLCQQGVVGMWRAVPFFTGVGYLRLLITYLSCVYTTVHLALVVTNFFYTINTQTSLEDCLDVVLPEEFYERANSSVLCYVESLMAPMGEEPGYYTAVAFLIASLWIVLPFLLYKPVKFMKRIFYISGPLVLILGVVIMSCVGVWEDLLAIQKGSDWLNFLSPDIWHAATIQALCSVQVAGGYLVSTGDVIYSNTEAQWTTLALVGGNIAASWLGLVFWFAVGGSGVKDTSLVAVIHQVHYMAEEKRLGRTWPLLIFFTLAVSGIITMLALIYPLYDRLRLVSGRRWRALAAGASLLGAVAALAVLAGRLPALYLLEDIALPLLISLTTVLEISAFLFIYGWKVLIEDIEFLTGRALSKYWVMGWCIVPGVVAPVSAWWATTVAQDAAEWAQPPYCSSALVATTACALLVLLVCAAVAVAKQVQYDFIAKLRSSFQPSRHWGPRDPISHYHWVLRREEAQRSAAGARAARAGQQRPAPASDAPRSPRAFVSPRARRNHDRRSNSDDWFYTVFRKQFLRETAQDHFNNKCKRSKSLDWDYKHSSLHDVEKNLPVLSKESYLKHEVK